MQFDSLLDRRIRENGPSMKGVQTPEKIVETKGSHGMELPQWQILARLQTTLQPAST
jgi:hypothetical protein